MESKNLSKISQNSETALEKSVNPLSLPKISKISISVGLGNNKENKDIIDSIENELTAITGQKPKKTVAKKSISGFKVREGQHIGFKVTLRGKRMWQFLKKLTSVVLPRVRDFEGISDKSIDDCGNLSFSIKEQSVFPEIKPDESKCVWGMTITFSLDKKSRKNLVEQYYREIGIVFMKGANG